MHELFGKENKCTMIEDQPKFLQPESVSIMHFFKRFLGHLHG